MNQAGRPGNLGGQGSVVARRRSGLGREVTNDSEGFVYLWYSIFVDALHHSLFQCKGELTSEPSKPSK